ncbi:alpha/beta hydrolase family protein [Bacillus taeanensis]|uniref:S9 family peptidase n=1 Tax=Bacillus taeanensis TaxID=273032 RepID=A0A366Y5A1_9BACI|nr:prolyl oligopeptidase family serine peptidase [Bacillus taeanensis]RBW71391.1 S9 family peptidase [Bacillus taeanensis]
MQVENGVIIDKQRIPSPHPRIYLYVVTYISEGLKVKGMLAEPQWADKFPGFLYLRGGIKTVGMVRTARVIQFAAEGFVVMAPFYRGNKGGEGKEDFAGKDRYDAVHAVSILMNHSKVKRDSIHVFGFSRGGVMALWTALLKPSIRSVVTWGGVSDMTLTYEERVDLRKMMKRIIGGSIWKVPDHYEARTPILQLDQLRAPVLIIHGVKDENVGIEHAYRLKGALEKRNKQVTSWIYEEYDHYFPPHFNRYIVSELTKWMKSQ